MSEMTREEWLDYLEAAVLDTSFYPREIVSMISTLFSMDRGKRFFKYYIDINKESFGEFFSRPLQSTLGDFFLMLGAPFLILWWPFQMVLGVLVILSLPFLGRYYTKVHVRSELLYNASYYFNGQKHYSVQGWKDDFYEAVKERPALEEFRYRNLIFPEGKDGLYRRAESHDCEEE